jgi:hypothetical protein
MNMFQPSEDPKIKALRDDAMAKLREAERAMYAYWTECDVGPEREWGANMYEIVRTAPRAARE